MANQHLTSPPTDMLRARLKVLLENTNSLYQDSKNVLEEDIVNSYHEALETFLQSLDGSIVGVASKIQAGFPADPLMYNIITNSILRDMDALFSEVSALDKIVVSSFNSIMSERDQVQQISRRISNKLGDYLLYADPSLGGGFFFGDSFNSAERIDVNSVLVDGDQCLLGQEEGVVLLPLDGEPDRPKVKSYIINAPSNGTSGNNQEMDVVSKDNIAAIGDNEPNTWFEYEKVSAYESNQPLILDLTIALDKISVINHININPINFGTFTPVKIISIETSKDGQEYKSIMDEVPIRDFASEENSSNFELSPSSSKFAGQGFWSFLPRKAQYVHIVLQQETPYVINTINGERRRYAIGIRDINVLGRKFKEEGSLVSSQFSSQKDIRKISMWASENPTEASELADIYHFISENDGATWRPLQPQGRDGFDIPEVINYNNISENSVSTDTEVNKFRHKISMKRNKDSFEGEAVVKRERVNKNDLLSFSGGDTELILTQKPISDTVRIVLPFYGSYSCPNYRNGLGVPGQSSPMELDFLEFSVDQTPVDSLRFKLPFKDIHNLDKHIRVLINGEQIEFMQKSDINNGRDTSYQGNWLSMTSDQKAAAKVYFLNKNGRELQFRHNSVGFLPPGGALIQVCLDGDNPRLELTDRGYVLNLTSPSDGFKENVSLVSVDALSIDESVDKGFRCTPGLKKYKVPVNLIGKRVPVTSSSSDDNVETILNRGSNSQVKESEEGFPIPVINQDIDTWEIQEYLDGVPYHTPYFPNKVTYINGHSEFYDGDTYQEDRYSFDPSTGMLYLASKCPYRITVLFKYNVVKYTDVPVNGWKYYTSSISNKINTSKIVLDPKYVKTNRRIYDKDNYDSLRSIDLVGDSSDSNGVILQPDGHGWHKQRLVKGTVSIKGIFSSDSSPVEVPYINGETELSTTKTVTDEKVLASLNADNIYEFTLKQINNVNILDGDPGFAVVRSLTSVTTPQSQFSRSSYSTTDDPTTMTDGQWCYVIGTDGSCTVYIKLPSTEDLYDYIVEYRYHVNDPGIDSGSLYSIDYENGIIHFSEEISDTGQIQYEVSTYSAFYNIAEVVDGNNIEEISEEDKKITISSSLSMQMLKLSSPLKARPTYVRVLYDYYKESTESLKDIEKYFSPICKDVAFRAISSDVLEEL